MFQSLLTTSRIHRKIT